MSTTIRSRSYWAEAARSFRNTRMLVFAALIVALRVAVKFLRVPLAAGLELSLDAYVNSLGSLVYGPLMGLAVGAVSDTVGCILAPTGAYFLPFILVEMTSSFLFGLFFWKQKLSVPRVLAAKFSVNLICNIVMTSLFMKWDYLVFYGAAEAQGYAIINLVRIVKNLVLFPLEAILILLVLDALRPAITSLGLADSIDSLKPKKKEIILLIGISVYTLIPVIEYAVYAVKLLINKKSIPVFADFFDVEKNPLGHWTLLAVLGSLLLAGLVYGLVRGIQYLIRHRGQWHFTRKMLITIIVVIAVLMVAIALLVFYGSFLQDFVKTHNLKLW